MRKNKLSKHFIDAWVNMDTDKLALCLSSKVRVFESDKESSIDSRAKFLEYSKNLFATLKIQKASVIPICCENGNYYELIYTFIIPVAVSNGKMITDVSVEDATMEIRKVFVKTYVYLWCNMFNIKKITFLDKKIN